MNNKIYKLIEIQYFGDIYYYFNLVKSTYIYFNDELWHEKGNSRNRTRIMGANNRLSLSVPLEGGRSVRVPVKDLKICRREPWQRIHWRGIHDSYRKSPWFEEYAPTLENIIKQNYHFLWDLNLRTFEWVYKALDLNSAILANKDDFAPDVCMDDVHFSSEFQTEKYPVYRQVFSDKLGFMPNLSILDLILNEGPMAKEYLKKLADFHRP